MITLGLTTAPIAKSVPDGYAAIAPRYGPGGGGWFSLFPIVREAFAGAWQRNLTVATENVLTFGALYACVTLIASDIAKVRIKLVRHNDNGLWDEVDGNSPFWSVLRKPNHFQTRIKFIESWLCSKLIHGNAFILKQRQDRRGLVTGLYVLDPTRVKPLVAPNGEVFYAVNADNLAGLSEAVTVPASEIIHDVMVPLYHPLCGVSPITACGLAALQGLHVQNHSSHLFANGVTPGGLLIAPGPISATDAKVLQEQWEQNYGGENVGRLAVLGNGLKFERMAMSSVDAQLIEQLKWTAENVCTAYHVPPFKIGVAEPPSNSTVEALNIQYYSQCLQSHIEHIELLLDEGLELPTGTGTEFDIDELLRMDTATRMSAASEAIKSGASPNEVRFRYHDLGPVQGGETPYMQEQNWPLRLLAARELPNRPPTQPTPLPGESADDEAKRFEVRMQKAMALVA